MVGTHGRSIWILDDLTPIREYSNRVAADAVHLFRRQGRRRAGATDRATGARAAAFANPPHGAVDLLRAQGRSEGRSPDRDPRRPRSRRPDAEQHAAPSRWAATTTRDAEDYKDEALPRGAGVQRAVWDLRYEGARKIKNGRIDTGDPRNGPRVPPGHVHGEADRRRQDADRAAEGRARSARRAAADRSRRAGGVRRPRPRRHLEADRSRQPAALRPGAAEGAQQRARRRERPTPASPT